MSAGEVDTLNLLYDKLDGLLAESQGYYEGFLDANNMYKAGKIGEKEFFAKLGDYVVAYSALEFLGIKVMMELKKSLDRVAGGRAPGGTQSPGLMPGMGAPGPAMAAPPRAGTPQNPVGGPPSVVSPGGGFQEPGTLPAPDPSLVAPPQAPAAAACGSCGAALRPGAKFCTKCGARA